MPRFFFNVAGPNTIDQEGEEYSSKGAARKAVLEGAREILSEGVLAGWSMTNWKMTVIDESGEAVYEVPITVAALATQPQ